MQFELPFAIVDAIQIMFNNNNRKQTNIEHFLFEFFLKL